MSTTRRNVLKILGGGAIVAAAGGAAFLSTRTPHRALKPWKNAGSGYGDPRLEILSWAILAPNPHNRQPWVVRLDDHDGFTLFAEPERKLPHTDPFDRQITIGLGCFIEVARIAASQLGYALQITPFPEGEPEVVLDRRPVASVVVTPSEATPDRLFAAIAQRRSCKQPFDMERPVTAEQLATLLALSNDRVVLGATTDPEAVAKLRELGWRAHLLEGTTPRTYAESTELMRIGKAEIEANPDGISLGGPLLDTLNLLGLLTHEQVEDPNSSAYRQGLDMYQEMFIHTPAFVWMSTAGNTRVEQLAAGASWLRLNLTTTSAGLALHPVSQALQEYPEMATLFDEMHTALGATDGQRVQMLGRLGYGPQTPPSPRWPLKTRMTA